MSKGLKLYHFSWFKKMKRANTTRDHHPSSLLSREENDIVFSLFGPRCESLATTVVQLFSTSPPEHCEWYKQDAGVLCLIKDHFKRSYYFRIYCPERRMMIWEHEVYNSMQYNAPKSYLHTFEAQDCIIAFNFASEEEACWLRAILLDKLESKKQRRERRSRSSFYPKEKPKHKPSHMTNGVINPADKYSPQPLHTHTPIELHSDTKDEKKKNKKRFDKKITKADIGNPEGFRHVSHVGWDANKGFDAVLGNEESPEMKKFFHQAGVSDSQLKDKDTRDFIYDFIKHNGGIDRVVNEVSQVAPNFDKAGKDNHSIGTTRYERDAVSRPPPLPVRNTPSVANRAAPPPPPSRTVPAPPPPIQTPPPPPPLRTLPQHPTAIGGGPPPPPPPPMPVSMLAPSPPPMPTSAAPELPQSDTHSALMESIRLGTTLRKVDVDCESKNSDSRGELLTQIRQGISLRPVQPTAKPVSSGPPENSLADALARALAERSRFIHSDSSTSSEDEEDDDDEWED